MKTFRKPKWAQRPPTTANQQCQSTEGNRKCSSQPVARPHPFFFHHWTPGGRGVVPL